jgi:serine/threonine-protein kinase HipA
MSNILIILRRAVFAWLIADGDMHLKNLALLKIAEPGDDAFRSVRMAPLYDAVTTRIFPSLKHDHMALKLNGKNDRLNAKDFRTFASTARLKAADADGVIDNTLVRSGVRSIGFHCQLLPNTAPTASRWQTRCLHSFVRA